MQPAARSRNRILPVSRQPHASLPSHMPFSFPGVNPVLTFVTITSLLFFMGLSAMYISQVLGPFFDPRIILYAFFYVFFFHSTLCILRFIHVDVAAVLLLLPLLHSIPLHEYTNLLTHSTKWPVGSFPLPF